MKRINNMSKEKAQRILFITVLILVFGVFFYSLSLIKPTDDVPPIVDDPIINDPVIPNDPAPVIETILAPVTGELELIRKFWTTTQTEEDQLISLINTGSLYQNSKGVSYSDDNKEFNVFASLSGTVVSVTDSPIYGKTVTIEHEENIRTEYISLGFVEVEVGDVVDQGDLVGKSGTNEFDRDALNHVHFKISVNGKYKDPEQLIGKKVNNLG